jgi:hypothetical protein
VKLLEPGVRDETAQRYVDSFDAASSRRSARSRLEQAARALLGMAPAKRPTRIGGKTLKLSLRRVPFASATPDDCARARDRLLETHSRRAAGAVCGSLRGALRQAGTLTLAHVDALRIDAQTANGRTVRDVVAEWNADDAAALRASFESDARPLALIAGSSGV